jgi:hypothetical protein
VSLQSSSFTNSKSEIEIRNSEIKLNPKSKFPIPNYRDGAGGAGGGGGGAKCLAAQPVLKAKYIAASTIIAVIFFIAICL